MAWNFNWDLATILVLLTLGSGLIWLFDKWFLAPHRATEAKEIQKKQVPLIVDLARSLFPVFLIVLLLRSFLVEPFRIPSGSMMPTLLVGDFILVNKFAYGIRLPMFNNKVIEIGEPQRGDIVVFRYPEEPSIPYIKRIIALPGDHLEYNDTNKMLYINNEPVPQQFVKTYIGVGAGSGMTGSELRIEDLPGAKHKILIIPNGGQPAIIKEWTVPQKQYVVFGDNRDNSRDSRFWGTVPEENLIGKAFFIWMNWDLKNGGISWQRIGTNLH
jgi:signal peptidase I